MRINFKTHTKKRKIHFHPKTLFVHRSLAVTTQTLTACTLSEIVYIPNSQVAAGEYANLHTKDCKYSLVQTKTVRSKYIIMIYNIIFEVAKLRYQFERKISLCHWTKRKGC